MSVNCGLSNVKISVSIIVSENEKHQYLRFVDV